jgi:hypothetical protein
LTTRHVASLDGRIIGKIGCEADCFEVGRSNCKDGLKFIDLNISEIGDLNTKSLSINNKIFILIRGNSKQVFRKSKIQSLSGRREWSP